MRKHITSKHVIHNGLFRCPSCDYRTEDISLVLKHISTRHDELKVIEVLWENL